MSELLIGSNNQSKVTMYREMLGSELTVVTPADLGLNLDITEDLFDIVGNSQEKARKFATEAGRLALSDDSGIFIPALGGEPGVAARRWAGELPADISDRDWIKYFLRKTRDLKGDDRAASIRRVISVANPAGSVETHDFVTTGTLMRLPSPLGYQPGGPFAAYFRHDTFGKAESELSTEEKNIYYSEIRTRILQSVKDLTSVVE